MKGGVSKPEVQTRLKEYGYNEMPSATKKSVATIVLEVVKEPMFILLLICGSLYVLLGEYAEGVILELKKILKRWQRIIDIIFPLFGEFY